MLRNNERSLEHFSKNHSPLSQIILGGQDGLVNVLGLVLGLAVASDQPKIVLAGGFAALLAESISMGAVAYTSKKAEQELYQAEVKKESQELKKEPELEKEEVENIFRKKGFSGKMLQKIINHIILNKKVWLSTMMTEEVQLAPIKNKDVIRQSTIVGISTITGSVIPIIPFLIFPINISIYLSLVLSSIALFLVGFYKWKKTLRHPLRSGLELALIGMGAAFVGFVVGNIFKI